MGGSYSGNVLRITNARGKREKAHKLRLGVDKSDIERGLQLLGHLAASKTATHDHNLLSLCKAIKVISVLRFRHTTGTADPSAERA